MSFPFDSTSAPNPTPSKRIALGITLPEKYNIAPTECNHPLNRRKRGEYATVEGDYSVKEWCEPCGFATLDFTLPITSEHHE